MKIGFVGLGNMGAAIAANLVRAGHDAAVWNRTASKAQGLVQAGAVLLTSPRAVAAGCDVVFSMLADDSALHAVLDGEDGLCAGLKRGALHVSMSTIAVATADQLAATHSALGQRFLCAPVFGRPEAAVRVVTNRIGATCPADDAASASSSEASCASSSSCACGAS